MKVNYIDVLKENNKYTVRQMTNDGYVLDQDHPIYSECQAMRQARRLAVVRKVKLVGIVEWRI